MSLRDRAMWIYIAKAATGAVLVFILSRLFNYSDIGWCLISVELVLSPDSLEAVPLALTRMKANLSGGFASLLCLLLGPPEFYMIIVALALTIMLCSSFKLMAGSRSALAAVIIIMLHRGEPNYSMWGTVIERVLSVVIGCSLGVLITYAFHGRTTKAPDVLPVGDE
jgi:uncharacterized membrane protein YgaE (UPF0421/DUF939 family)